MQPRLRPNGAGPAERQRYHACDLLVRSVEVQRVFNHIVRPPADRHGPNSERAGDEVELSRCRSGILMKSPSEWFGHEPSGRGNR